MGTQLTDEDERPPSGVQIKFYNYHEYLKPRTSPGPQVLVTDFPNVYNIDELKQMNQRVVRIPRCYNSEDSQQGDKLSRGKAPVDLLTVCPQFSEYFPGKEPGGLQADPGDTMALMSSDTILNGLISPQELLEVVSRVNSLCREAFLPSWKIGFMNIVNHLSLWLYNPYRQYTASKLEDVDKVIKEANEQYESRGLEFIHPMRSGFLSVSLVTKSVAWIDTTKP